MNVDANERIRPVLHNPGDELQIRRKAFKESSGVMAEKLHRVRRKIVLRDRDYQVYLLFLSMI